MEWITERLAFQSCVTLHGTQLRLEDAPLAAIADTFGTPTYVYSMAEVHRNVAAIRSAFAELHPHIHYSAKANANLFILRELAGLGIGIDAVSGGEIFRALQAGFSGERIVFAGVGKTAAEIRYALEQRVAWFNVENTDELRLIAAMIEEVRPGYQPKIALRYNPEVSAHTHPGIATGHGGAKFGLTADAIMRIQREDLKAGLALEGIHLHIGSQLADIDGTVQAVRQAVQLAGALGGIRTINLGGGLPVAYQRSDRFPPPEAFAQALAPLLKGYEVILEPGRSIIASAGVLLTTLLYVKEQPGQLFYIVDASMTDLLRPALYGSWHEIVPLDVSSTGLVRAQVTGPVCETTDVLSPVIDVPKLAPGTRLALLTAGAYGQVMASNYNARPRPAEVAILPDRRTPTLIRRRETWEDLIAAEH
jgi:diaminopimelate decarboxylase